MFGQNLKSARIEKGYTLEQLASLYNKTFGGGLSKGTLSKYENGKQEPMISVVSNLSSLLNVSVDTLLGKPIKNTASDAVKNINREKIMDMLGQLSEERQSMIESLIVLEWTQQQRK